MARVGLAIVCAAVALVAAACGGGDDAGDAVPAAAATPCDATGAASLASAACAAKGVDSLDRKFTDDFAAPAAPADACTSSPAVVFYAADDWMRLAQKLAADGYGCAEYYISVPPVEDADGLFTIPNNGQAERIRALGERFHAMAEFRVDAWTEWRERHPGTSWKEIGAEYGKRVEAAGYDLADGDLWAVNEFPLSIVSDASVRASMAELVAGLAQGGSASAPGLVFVVSPEQTSSGLEAYRAGVADLLHDDPFWHGMEKSVRFWAQEVYANPGSCCVAGADASTRVSRLNEYLQHVVTLARSDARAGTAGEFLERTYTPLGNAAWAWSASYGDTAIPVDEMARFVAQQVEAMRSTGEAEGAALGLAWAPLQPANVGEDTFAADTATILERMARSIDDSLRKNDPKAACTGEDGCRCEIAGAAFADGWSIFAR